MNEKSGASLVTVLLFADQMRIPYLNIPCILNETCFHGRCIRVKDLLIGWYEFCLCNRHFSGYECEQQTILSRIDWFVLVTIVLICVGTCFCLACIPLCYSFLENDFYPQIIECARSTPYVEVRSPTNNVSLTGVRIYRIPSERLATRRTIVDGLIPLHTVASLAYLTRVRRMMFGNDRRTTSREILQTPASETLPQMIDTWENDAMPVPLAITSQTILASDGPPQSDANSAL